MFCPICTRLSHGSFSTKCRKVRVLPPKIKQFSLRHHEGLPTIAPGLEVLIEVATSYHLPYILCSMYKSIYLPATPFSLLSLFAARFSACTAVPAGWTGSLFVRSAATCGWQVEFFCGAGTTEGIPSGGGGGGGSSSSEAPNRFEVAFEISTIHPPARPACATRLRKVGGKGGMKEGVMSIGKNSSAPVEDGVTVDLLHLLLFLSCFSSDSSAYDQMH